MVSLGHNELIMKLGLAEIFLQKKVFYKLSVMWNSGKIIWYLFVATLFVKFKYKNIITIITLTYIEWLTHNERKNTFMLNQHHSVPFYWQLTLKK